MNSTSEIFVIPIESGQYIVYIPLRSVAFVANASLVNVIADLDPVLPSVAIDSLVMNFLQNNDLFEPMKKHKYRKRPIFPILSIDLSSNFNSIDRNSTGNNLTNYQRYQKIYHESFFYKIDTAINIAAQIALDMGSNSFAIQVYAPEEIECIYDFISDIFSIAESVSQRKGLQLTSNIKIPQPLKYKRAEDLLKLFDEATVVLPMPVNDNGSFEIKSKGNSNDWQPIMQTLDKFKLPYVVNLNVLPNQIHLLSVSVRYLSENYCMEEIIVETDFLNYTPANTPSSHTERFLSEIRKAASVASVFDKRMYFNGTDLDNPKDFSGFRTDEYKLLNDGSIIASHSGKIHTNSLSDDNASSIYELILNENREYCKGCFAKFNCLGPNYKGKGKEAPTKSFSGYERCHLIQELTKDQLIGKIAASGGMAWIDIDNNISLREGYKGPNETRFLS